MKWKYILTIVILAAIVGGGIWLFTWYKTIPTAEVQCEIGKKYKTEECQCPKETLPHPLYDEERQEWLMICKPVSVKPIPQPSEEIPSEIPYEDIGLRVTFQTGVWLDHPEIPQAMLWWDKGAIKEMIVSEVDKEDGEAETLLFKMSPMEGYEDRSFGKPAIIGSMPGGFRITEGGSVSEWTTGVTYRVKVIGEIGGEKFWSMTDFSR